MQSVPITTNVVSSIPTQRGVLDITLCEKFLLSYLRQVGGFLRIRRFPRPIKLTATILLKYCLKWR